jgi:RNA polymerase sigma-70 factor (ECF subfamily)
VKVQCINKSPKGDDRFLAAGFAKANGMTEHASRPITLDDFSHLVETFQSRLVRYAYRRLGNMHEAEDAAQEVFVRAYTSGLHGREVAHLNAYLYRMASNICTDLLRRRRRRNVWLMQAGHASGAVDHADGSRSAMAAEELGRIEALLGRIPRRQAEVIRLRVFDELSLRDIAEVLDCPLATIKSRLRYGLETLRKLLPHKAGS